MNRSRNERDNMEKEFRERFAAEAVAAEPEGTHCRLRTWARGEAGSEELVVAARMEVARRAAGGKFPHEKLPERVTLREAARVQRWTKGW